MRVYTKDNKRYLSVTAIVDLMYGFDKDGFDLWATQNCLSADWITRHSAQLGTKYHTYFENKYYGISDWADITDDKDDEMFLLSVGDFTDKGWEILESEKEVYCDEFNFAGRFDLIIKNDSLAIHRAIGDIKTWGAWNKRTYKRNKEKIKKLAIQLSMYRYALGEEIPMFLIVPQINGQCVIEEIAPTDEWKSWIKRNADFIGKILKSDELLQGVEGC